MNYNDVNEIVYRALEAHYALNDVRPLIVLLSRDNWRQVHSSLTQMQMFMYVQTMQGAEDKDYNRDVMHFTDGVRVCWTPFFKHDPNAVSDGYLISIESYE